MTKNKSTIYCFKGILNLSAPHQFEGIRSCNLFFFFFLINPACKDVIFNKIIYTSTLFMCGLLLALAVLEAAVKPMERL